MKIASDADAGHADSIEPKTSPCNFVCNLQSNEKERTHELRLPLGKGLWTAKRNYAVLRQAQLNSDCVEAGKRELILINKVYQFF
jgi:hypothetical protein